MSHIVVVSSFSVSLKYRRPSYPTPNPAAYLFLPDIYFNWRELTTARK